MLTHSGPKISSIEDKLEALSIGRIPYSTLAKTYLEVTEEGDYTVDLEAVDYLKYMHIRFNHIEKVFKNGKMEKK